MVFFFIAYLIIIIIFCFPFNVKFVVFYDKTSKKRRFIVKIGFFVFNCKNLKKKSKKKRRYFKIYVKKIIFPSIIDFQYNVNILYPKFVRNFIFLKNLTRAKKNNSSYKNIHAVSSKNNSIFILNVFFSIKFNIFILFSLFLQTLKISRSK